MIDVLRSLRGHIRWADARLLKALETAPSPPADAIRELAHVLGADETWLARIEGRAPRAPVWPTLPMPGIARLAAEVHAGYDTYLDRATEAELERQISYINSAGVAYRNSVLDSLLHAALHAQYHRGKINLLLRQAGLPPVSLDYIAYVRESGMPR